MDEQRILHRLFKCVDYKRQFQQQQSGLSYTQMHVLEDIVEVEASKTLELGRKTGLPGATLIGVLNELEKRRLVLRERSGEDKRVVWVKATEVGEALVAQHLREDEQFRRNLTAGLEEAERRQFYGLLEKTLSAVGSLENLFKGVRDESIE